MTADPFLGVLLHAIGGLASASFYLPYRRVVRWSWETYWLVGGFFSWVIAPWIFAWVAVPDLMKVLHETPARHLFWSYCFGALWGLGGLTFGLTMRYLGIALGMAMALGYCAVFGTLLPPIVSGELLGIIQTASGAVVMMGVVVCLAGIAISGLAGMSKERELSQEEKRMTIKEFNFPKGFLVATFAGVMSASMAYGFAAGKPIAALAIKHGALELWQNLPVLVVILAGGFTTNFIWCVALNLKNRTWGDYLDDRRHAAATGHPRGMTREEPALFSNYLFSATAGLIWYLQFFFYSMGTTKMGQYDFSSWTLHMASIIIFATLWGVVLHEWKGSGKRTLGLVVIGLVALVSSTIIVGYGNSLGARPRDNRNQPGGGTEAKEAMKWP